MSALDFGAGSGTNSTRWYSLTGIQLSGDFTITWWMKNEYTSGSDYQAPFGQKVIDTANAIHVMYHQASYPTWAGYWSINLRDNAGASIVNTIFGDGPLGGDSTLYFMAIVRSSTTLKLYQVPKGGDASSTSNWDSASCTTGTIDASADFRIGKDRISGTRYWRDLLGEFTMHSGVAYSEAALTAMAAGARYPSQPGILLPFRDGAVSTEVNLGSNGSTSDATLTGTGYTTGPDFFKWPRGSLTMLGVG